MPKICSVSSEGSNYAINGLKQNINMTNALYDQINFDRIEFLTLYYRDR